MKLIFRNITNKKIKSISFNNFEIDKNVIHEINNFQNLNKAELITENEKINSKELLKLKLTLEKLNINFMHIYSNNRETILSGKSLKINSTLINKKEAKNELFEPLINYQSGIIHKGTVRSGDRISSNGDLFIVGDVNPGAIVSATKNVYVWGKLLGIALAGEDGDKNASIASLYLSPLQLRICDFVAIGPKDKPIGQYPEVAVIEGKAIIIKPLLISN